MTAIKRCPICTYHEATPHLFSLLGTAGICLDCYEHRAETPVSFHQAVKQRDQPTTPPVFKDAIKEQIAKVHFWLGPDEGYLDLAAYEKRMSQQQLVTIKTAEEIEDEAMARAMAQKIIDTAVDGFERRPTVLERVRQFFRGWWQAWDEAVSAGL